MSKPCGDTADNLESALLCLGREPQVLALALVVLLGAEKATDLASSVSRRKSGKLSVPLILANAVLQSKKSRDKVIIELLEHMPEPIKLSKALLSKKNQNYLSRDAKLGHLSNLLNGTDLSDWEEALAKFSDWSDELGELPELHEDNGEPETKKPVSSAKVSKLNQRIKKLEDEKAKLKSQLLQRKGELSRLQTEIGTAHRRHQDVCEELADAKSEAREEHQRATEFKNKLSQTTSPDKREQTLRDELRAISSENSVLKQKFAMVEAEREDLRACLQDHDQFNNLPEEEIPSFRDRPLTSGEQELVAAIANKGGKPARILVVGGGQQQTRHLEKFQEYASVVGFTGSWRMAEYESWHKEMDRLSKDMENNYDALVILHWNRTTFTRKAREICNIKGQKPCITCHYEGFVSLRKTLGKCLRQVLSRD